MKKIVPLFAFALLALVGSSPAQEMPTPSGAAAGDSRSGDLLNARRPTAKPTAAPATDSGKKTVGDAMLATDEKGKNVTTSFPTGTATVYLLTKNVSGSKGDKVKADWIVDDAGKALPKGKHYYSSEVTLPDSAPYPPSFHASSLVKGAYPPGKYHVDLSVGGQKLKSLKFTVQ